METTAVRERASTVRFMSDSWWFKRDG